MITAEVWTAFQLLVTFPNSVGSDRQAGGDLILTPYVALLSSLLGVMRFKYTEWIATSEAGAKI